MKMTYLSKTNSTAKKRKLAFVFLLATLFAISRFAFAGELSGSLASLSIPFLNFKNSVLHNPERSELKAKIAELEAKLQTQEMIQKENEELKGILGRKEGRNLTLAVAISKPSVSPFDTLMIDIGQDKNIQEGKFVYTGGSIAIGRVSEVYEHSSKITLFSSPDQRYLVSIGPNHIQATSTGQGGGNFKVTLPQGVDIKEGDEIVIPSITPFLFGRVEKVSQGDQPSFVNIYFKSPVNINELYYVEVES